MNEILKNPPISKTVMINKHKLQYDNQKPLITRTAGTAKGKIFISENFNEPLPDSIINTFYK